MATSLTAPTTEMMKGKAGVIDGKLHLSQGVVRDLAPGSIGGQFTEIPGIDLTALHSSTATVIDKRKLRDELYDACTRSGFFVITNHGIDWTVVDEAFAGLKGFFALPTEKKMEVHQSKSNCYSGYEQPYYTNVDRLKKGGKVWSAG